eukprot:9505105-Prorocentrum_lima.AAC.1
MTSSLVGSEMCIRDRFRTRPRVSGWKRGLPRRDGCACSVECKRITWTVSYTHLTLPTICSV